MKIRPRNNILFAKTGVLFSANNLNGSNWRLLVFDNYKLYILDLLSKYGEALDYGQWLNEMLSRHANLYKMAGHDWQKLAYENNLVGLYLQDYRGGLSNNGEYKRFGSIQIPEDRYDFNVGISPNFSTRYNITNPPKRISGDRPKQFKIDNLYSAITDDRRILGREGDWDLQSLTEWNNLLRNIGWEMLLDNDKYYKLKRLSTLNLNLPNPKEILGISVSETPSIELKINPLNNDKINNIKIDFGDKKLQGISAFSSPTESILTPIDPLNNDKINKSVKNKIKAFRKNNGYGFDWNKLKEAGAKIFGNPSLYAFGRLAGNLINNEKVYNESLKGIKPVLRLSYNTYRQVAGDEATKQGYYRRAALMQTRAAQPFTSDADRLMAYLYEMYDKANELKAQGDLVDNQRIRETSEQASQHADANRQRATEVANANIASINLANALKHNLLAQKHSAQWSSIDNFLQGVEYRKRLQLAEQLSLDNDIFALTERGRLSNDPRILDANQELELAIKRNTSNGRVNWYAKDVLDALNKLSTLLTQLAIESKKRLLKYFRDRDLTSFIKEGGKITRKRKDDLLYKSTKDVVEHFRKMSKLSSDALNRKYPKIEKITSHPKGTKKYLLGGVAPFTVYKPVALGGETSSSSSISSTSKKKSEGDDTLDMIKELFKTVAGKGLPSDVNNLYINMLNFLGRAKAFGQELSTEDIASMYLSNLLELNTIEYLKKLHDDAVQIATNNNALNEFAVNNLGLLAVQNPKTGDIEYVKSFSEALEKGLRLITNGQLEQLRAVIPNFASRRDLDNVIANGIGIDKIASYLKSQLPSLGTSEKTIEGYTKKGTNDIVNGLRLLQEAPEGDYKYSNYTKELLNQAKVAINYLKGVLPNNMRAIIKLHADLGGLTEDLLIGSLVSSGIDNDTKILINAVTGKASKDTNGNSKEGFGDNDMIPAIAFFNGMGEKSTFIILDKTKTGLKINTISTPITYKGYNTGSITFDKLESSDFGGQLIMNQATMGDSLISSTGRLNIIIDGRIYQAELPIDLEAKRNGVTKPDLKFLKNIEIIDAKLKLMGIDKSDPKNIPTINKVYQDNGLPILYTILNNKPVITSEYARFAIVNGIGTEEAFGENPEFNDGIQEISSDKERLLFESLMLLIRNNNKYKLDNGISILGLGSWGETSLYKGIIYIPMVNSNISALAGTGYKAKGDEYNEIEAKQQAADAARELRFKPAGDASKIQ